MEAIYDFQNNRATFDLAPMIDRAKRQVDQAVESHVIEILQEAFEAGYQKGYDDSHTGELPMPGLDFYEWLDAKRQEIRCRQP